MKVTNNSDGIVKGGWDSVDYVFQPRETKEVTDEIAARHLVETATLEGVKVLSLEEVAAELPTEAIEEAPAEEATPRRSRKS